MEEQLLDLILTCEKENIELAFILMESQEIDSEEFIKRYFGELLDWYFGIGNLKNVLEITYFADNVNDCKLPDSFPNLRNLRRFKMSGCELSDYSHIFSTVSQLPNLKLLFLIDSNISTLPENIGDLNNLKKIFLGGNNIQKLPESLSKLYELEVLELSDNPLPISEQRNIQKLLPNCQIFF